MSISSTCEAILKAFTNLVCQSKEVLFLYIFSIQVHSIYLISEGNSSDSAREMLRDNIVKTRLSSNTPIPVHVVSLFCQNNDTEVFLRSIAQTADGRSDEFFFTYIFISLSVSSFFSQKISPQPVDSKTAFEHPIDIALMYKEINQCQNIIDRLEKILGVMRDDDGDDKTLATINSNRRNSSLFYVCYF